MVRTNSIRTKKQPARPERVREVLDSLRRIVRELRLTAREAERRAGMSGAQLFVLQTLADADASSLNDLAERTLTDQSSVSVVVSRLSERKLLQRRPSSHDARRIELALTPAGRRMLARCPEPTQARLLSAVRCLTDPELDALTSGLTALIREMGIANLAARMFFDEEGATSRTRRARPSSAQQT
jgi:DNA-binding MarR family transcriptional regulator